MTPQYWRDYFSVTAEVSATLSGLVFISTSINLTQIADAPVLTDLALESLVQLTGAMMVSLVALIPGQAMQLLGTELLSLTALLWTLQTSFQTAFVRAHTLIPWRWVANRFARTQVACVPFFVGGVLLCMRSETGYYWIVPGLLFSYMAGISNAWGLLVKIVRMKGSLPTWRSREDDGQGD